MPKFKNSNATFWVIFKQCAFLLLLIVFKDLSKSLIFTTLWAFNENFKIRISKFFWQKIFVKLKFCSFVNKLSRLFKTCWDSLYVLRQKNQQYNLTSFGAKIQILEKLEMFQNTEHFLSRFLYIFCCFLVPI